MTAQAASCAAFVGAIANASYALLHAFPAALPPIMGAAILTAFQDIHGHFEESVRQKALPPFAASSREILEFFALPEHRARAHAGSAPSLGDQDGSQRAVSAPP